MELGKIIAAWSGATNEISVVRTSVAIAEDSSGEQKTVRFAMQSETANFLTWTAFDRNPSELRVYRDGTWIDSLVPAATSYVDQLRVAGETPTYTITALDSDGNVINSTSITVTIE